MPSAPAAGGAPASARTRAPWREIHLCGVSSRSLTPTLAVRPALSACVAAALSAGLAVAPAHAQDPHDPRAHEPAVLTGADVPGLVGVEPGDIVAFRHDEAGWVPVPVQVDERALIDLGSAYGPLDPEACAVVGWCTGLTGHVALTTWTDPGTFVGPDPTPWLDDDDEIALMARDAGAAAPPGARAPAGVDAASAHEVRVGPRESQGARFAYLFRRTAPLDPSAGTPYVAYASSLLDGAYLDTYDRAGGPPDGGAPAGSALGANPETTTFRSDTYGMTFADRWIQTGLALMGAEGEPRDLLDRAKIMLWPGDCGRHETTGSRSEGAFVAHRAGPVRAIRSVVGFNSGPLVQRDHVLYDRLSVVTTTMRVHPIRGIVLADDYSPEAVGWTFSTPASTSVIDGRPDSVPDEVPAWSALRGDAGSAVSTLRVDTDLADLDLRLHYLDSAAPGIPQCTGDAQALGTNGLWVASRLGNTDPRDGPASAFAVVRRTAYSREPLSTASVAATAAALRAPLRVTARPVAVTASAELAGPGRVRLSAPRPHPSVRPAATLHVGAPAALRLDVVDALGRVVRVLRDGLVGPGAHPVALDLAALPPGPYRLRLVHAGGVETRPLLRP